MRACALLLFMLALIPAACGPAQEHSQKRFAEPASSEVVICPGGATTPGIDVSSFQGTIDWAKVADGGVKFGIAKATEGLTVSDAQFANNWAQMKAHGVVRGAYQFFHPQDDGAEQADVFLAKVGTLGEPGDLPPVLDFEINDKQADGSYYPNSVVIAEAQKFIDEIKLKTGLDTIIYTYPSYWEGLGSPAQFAAHPLWLATYNGSLANCPSQLAPWAGFSLWQWAGDATSTSSPKNPYAGVSGEDLNVFNGSLDELRGWSTPPIAQPSSNSSLTAVNWPDQHVEIFGRSPAGTILHVATSGSGDDWTAADPLGSGIACGTAAAFWGAPGLVPELFAPLSSGQTGDILFSGGSWDAQALFGASSSEISTAVGNDGLANVFALGADGAIWANRWSASAWSGWTSLGGTFSTGASAITWGNGTIEIFATDASGTLWHDWTEPSSATGWASWAMLGSNVASHPAAVRWSDGSVGHAEVFARGRDNQLYHSEYSLSTGWPTSMSVISAGTEIIGTPSVLMNPAGSAQSGPEVFARDATGQVLHAVRAGAGDSMLEPLGEQLAASDPFGWIRGDGTAEVFAIDPVGNLVRNHRDASGVWGGWSAIASGFDACSSPNTQLPDGGLPDAGPDGGTLDAGDGDAGTDGIDAGSLDAGSSTGEPDGGPTDGGAHDAGSGTTQKAISAGCSSGPSNLLGLFALACGLACRKRAP